MDVVYGAPSSSLTLGHFRVPAQLKHCPPLLVPLHSVHLPEALQTSHFVLCSVIMDLEMQFVGHC